MPDPAAVPRLKPCPVCGKLSVERFQPFCCKRCADVDLHRWLAGVYAIPAAEHDERADDDEAPPEQRG